MSGVEKFRINCRGNNHLLSFKTQNRSPESSSQTAVQAGSKPGFHPGQRKGTLSLQETSGEEILEKSEIQYKGKGHTGP